MVLDSSQPNNGGIAMSHEESARKIALSIMALWLFTVLLCSFVAAAGSSWWTYRLMSGDIRTLQADMKLMLEQSRR
jgi:nitrate reductase NapE component